MLYRIQWSGRSNPSERNRVDENPSITSLYSIQIRNKKKVGQLDEGET